MKCSVPVLLGSDPSGKTRLALHMLESNLFHHLIVTTVLILVLVSVMTASMFTGLESQQLMHALQQPSLALVGNTSQQQLDTLTQQPHVLSERQTVISQRLR